MQADTRCLSLDLNHLGSLWYRFLFRSPGASRHRYLPTRLNFGEF